MPSSAWMLSFYRDNQKGNEVYPHELCCSLNEDRHCFYEFCLLMSGSQLHGLIFPLLPEVQQKLRMQLLHNGWPEILGWLLFSYLNTPLGADGWSQWAVIAARPCCSWWSWCCVDCVLMVCWWCGILWVTHIRLWLQPLSYYRLQFFCCRDVSATS